MWDVAYYPEAKEDLARLDGSVRGCALSAIQKLRANPERGEPLGNKHQRNLTGLRRVKLKKAGIRIVYEIQRTEGAIRIVVIGVRADDEVYRIAERRVQRLN